MRRRLEAKREVQPTARLAVGVEVHPNGSRYKTLETRPELSSLEMHDVLIIYIVQNISPACRRLAMSKWDGLGAVGRFPLTNERGHSLSPVIAET